MASLSLYVLSDHLYYFKCFFGLTSINSIFYFPTELKDILISIVFYRYILGCTSAKSNLLAKYLLKFLISIYFYSLKYRIIVDLPRSQDDFLKIANQLKMVNVVFSKKPKRQFYA